ncbi:protein MpLEA-like38 [Marchantia polymorpha subsp. ruderalis]|uniref:Uncharacterized protein n=3 Tax=Marchantia polymorpha TaxID=3197 RepID=A0AAF6BMZ0_MARPO|nr:hypothetical protein MARPO_1199s0001 [Marchantia polymorpha]BBN13374.1 hypothetical protein Mp_6g03010 [Marchantia polymorpha subsp. ruderalis]|eukprot:PTQ26519.1 hypothetical protein MARPO_1199s0001 [Marchantia polymorpha]
MLETVCKAGLLVSPHLQSESSHLHLSNSSLSYTWDFSCRILVTTNSSTMSSNQMQSAKDSAAQTTEHTKQFGAEKTGQAQDHAQGMGQAAKDKANQAGQATSDATQTAKDKAVEAKDNTGNALQQAGEKVKETLTNAKDAVTGNNQ